MFLHRLRPIQAMYFKNMYHIKCKKGLHFSELIKFVRYLHVFELGFHSSPYRIKYWTNINNYSYDDLRTRLDNRVSCVYQYHMLVECLTISRCYIHSGCKDDSIFFLNCYRRFLPISII